MLDENGMTHRRSLYSVSDTLLRLEAELAQRGIPVLARIDHSAAATKVGLEMKPTVLLIFGNAKSGTPLMLSAPTAALDLPLKALVWEDAAGAVWISTNTPEYLQDRHGFLPELKANIEGLRLIVDNAAASSNSV
jgi:uncharacterized protein (DUF302 family)